MPQPKLSEAKIQECRELRKQGKSCEEIGKITGVSHGAVSNHTRGILLTADKEPAEPLAHEVPPAV